MQAAKPAFFWTTAALRLPFLEGMQNSVILG